MCFVKEKDQNTNIFIQTFDFGKNLILVALSLDGCYSNTAEQKLMPRSTCQTGNVLSPCDFTDICSI